MPYQDVDLDRGDYPQEVFDRAWREFWDGTRMRALTGTVREWAAAQGCSRVYWHIRETNAAARLLYDKVAADDPPRG